jgi:hypothetical protein
MTNRIDLFMLVHKGIRWWLGTVNAVLGATDFETSGSVAALEAVDELFVALEAHALHEDTFIAPVVAAHAPERAAAWAAEHRRLEHVEAALRDHVATLRAVGPSHPTARATGLALYRGFNRFVAETLAHLDEEETELMPLLWATCSDAELVAIMTSFKARFGAEAAGFFRRAAPAYAEPERALLGV